MSAEVLREAARLMRERATSASEAWGEGPWHHQGLGYNDAHGMVYDVQDAQGTHLADADCEELAVHIASWHPAVALAVADWIIQVATARESLDAVAKVKSEPLGTGSDMFLAQERHALAVARAYLGSDQ